MNIRSKIELGIAILFLTLICPAISHAEQRYTPSASQAASINKLKANSDSQVKIQWNRQGVPAFITGNFRSVDAKGPGAEAAINFLNEYRDLFKLKDANQEFKHSRTDKDDLGFTHVRLRQQYQGVPVHGGELITHFNPKGQVSTINGNYLTGIAISVTPTLDSAKAVNIAKSDLETNKIDTTSTPPVNLEIYPLNKKYYLVWHSTLRIWGKEPGRWEYFVDAQDGEIIFKYNNLQFDGASTGTGKGVNGDTKSLNTYLSGGKYYLYDTTKAMRTGSGLCSGSGVIATINYGCSSTYPPSFSCPAGLSTDTDNNWNQTTTGPCGNWGCSHQGPEVDAHFNLGVVYNYYKNIHSRNSYNGSGASMKGYTHFDSCYDNAFWDGAEMVFGDGNGSTFKPFSGGLDVVGHELTHAVTETSANLDYIYQSGALNESFSDIFGEFIEAYHKGSADWLVGEDIYIPGGGLRNMIDPHNGDFNSCQSPLYYNGQPANMDEYVETDMDNGGVHINSGIPNHAAYLIAMGIGIDPARRIYYRALTYYLAQTSDFLADRRATLQACDDLYGIRDGKYTLIENTFDTVGIREPEPFYNNYTVANGFIGGGTAQNHKADEGSWFYTLPFSFPFFGKNYSTVNINNNGFLSFACYSDYNFDNDERRFSSWRMIAPLWVDLVTNGTIQSHEDIYIHQPTANSVCIRWKAETYSGNLPVNVETVLYSSGKIKFNYGSGNAGLTSPVIGISNGDGGNYIFSTQTTLTNANSIVFSLLPGAGVSKWYVDASAGSSGNGSENSPYRTIQEAINMANSDDTILVLPGVYTQNLYISNSSNKAITLKSLGYGAVIEGNGSGPAITFNFGETQTAVLDGFLIRNGNSGIKVANGSSPLIINNIIYSNATGVICSNSSPAIMNNTIAYNTTRGISAANGSNPYIINSIVWSNGNDEIYTASASVTVAYSDVKSGFAGSNIYSFNPRLADGDYRLTGSSPCIDMGISSYYGVEAPDHDIEGNTRPVPWGGKYDIGAHESRMTSHDIPGGDVVNVFLFSGVEITFTNITAGTVICSVSEYGPALPSGFTINGSPVYYNLSTTALFSSAEVCLPLSGQGTNLRLLHYSDGSWHDITVSKDNHKICGDVTSLSPFIIASAPSAASASTGGGSGSGGGGKASTKCFIATAAFGTPFAKEVQILRNFRDAYLLTNTLGQKFVSLYYRFSPPIADFIRDNSFLRAIVRTMLRPVIWLVQSLCPQCNPDAGAGPAPAPLRHLRPENN